MNGSHAVALALVVMFNWIIAHLANSWTMPPEVQSALQTVITVALAYWFGRASTTGTGNGAVPPTSETPKA